MLSRGNAWCLVYSAGLGIFGAGSEFCLYLFIMGFAANHLYLLSFHFLFLKSRETGAGEMAQCIRALPVKYEDPSLNAQHLNQRG